MSYESLVKKTGDTCEIHRKSRNQQDDGSIEDNYSLNQSGVATRKVAEGRPVDITGEADTIESDDTFYFLTNIDIINGDRIKFDGDFYEVVKVSQDSSSRTLYAFTRRVEVN